MTLFLNSLRRSARVGVIVGLGVFGFHFVIVRVFLTFFLSRQNLGSSIPRGIQSFFGMDKLPISTLTGFLSVGYQHPFMIAAMVAVPVVIATGLLTGEVERGSISFILSRPVRRVAVVLSAGASFVIWAIFVVAMAVAGSFTGAHFTHQQLPPLNVLWLVSSNLFILLLAIGGISFGISAVTSQRSDASGWIITIVLLMYVVNFVAQLWPAAQPYAQYSLFHYYVPSRILLTGVALAYDYYVLSIVAAAGFAYACFVYAVREFNV